MEIEKLYSLFLKSAGVTTDTRNIQKGNIFFALKGENFNGNQFAAEALNKGAAYSVVDEIVEQNERIIKVENVLKTLQQLALYHRRNFTGKLIALTGSNGKTTTKELIAAVLASTFKTQATKGNLNNHIGIPLTLLSMPVDLDFAVIEMGANHQKEIESYCHYVEPDFGMITNVGLAHVEGFGGFEGVVKGKTELYRFMAKGNGKLFLNADNEILTTKALEADFSEERLITYGTKQAFCVGKILEGDFLKLEAEGEVMHTNLVGNYNFENVLAAICIGKYFGVSAAKIKAAIESYVPSNNRSQRKEVNGCSVILDCYNANPSSMELALKNFGALPGDNKIVILGGMKELGEYSFDEHQRMASLAHSLNIRQCIFIGSEFENVSHHGVWFKETSQAKQLLSEYLKPGNALLVKGSRAYKLEELFT